MKTQIKTSTALIIIFATAVIFGGGALAYYNYAQPTTYDYEGQSNAVVTPKKTATATTTTTTPSTPKDETADWKTYENSTYGFSFKYPKSLVLNDQSTKDSNKFVSLATADNPSKQALFNVLINPSEQENTQTWKLGLDEILQAKINNTSISEQKKTTLATKPAYEGLDLGIVTSYMIFAKNGDNLFELLFGLTDKDTLEAAKATLTSTQKNILSTFKFTK